MALGAIIKSAGGALVKQQGKKLAADKLMGRGRKKTRGGKQRSGSGPEQLLWETLSSWSLGAAKLSGCFCWGKFRLLGLRFMRRRIETTAKMQRSSCIKFAVVVILITF